MVSGDPGKCREGFSYRPESHPPSPGSIHYPRYLLPALGWSLKSIGCVGTYWWQGWGRGELALLPWGLGRLPHGQSVLEGLSTVPTESLRSLAAQGLKIRSQEGQSKVEPWKGLIEQPVSSLSQNPLLYSSFSAPGLAHISQSPIATRFYF